jgi:hypothetical protein
MKTKAQLGLIVILFAAVANLHALTFADIAGVYDCKRTETFSDHVARYDETLVIMPDGYIINVIDVNGQQETYEGFVEMDDQGNLIDTELSGQFKGNGNHIELTVVWPPDLIAGGVTIKIKGVDTGGNWQDWYHP